MHIQDAVHGYIKLNSEEKAVIDTPQMQRLRKIQQLGLSSLVYPSASHSRFEHSLGVMELSDRFAENLKLSDHKKQEIRMAALLHDSGHGPFSHVSERVAEKQGYSHEDFSCRKIEELEDKYSNDPERLKSIIRGETEFGKIVAGDIDADRMDYLMRDSLNSGVQHGEIDAETIIRLAKMEDEKIVFSRKAVSALENLFTSRFHMLKTLYRHHTVQIADKMLERALADLANEIDIEDLMELNDYETHNLLLKSEGVSKRLYSRVNSRELYKRALVWDIDDVSREGLKSLEERIDNPREIEKEIAEECGIKDDKIILDKPETPEIIDIDVYIQKNGELKNLKNVSPITSSLEKAEWRNTQLKIYSPSENLEEVREASVNILSGYKNVLEEFL